MGVSLGQKTGASWGVVGCVGVQENKKKGLGADRSRSGKQTGEVANRGSDAMRFDFVQEARVWVRVKPLDALLANGDVKQVQFGDSLVPGNSEKLRGQKAPYSIQEPQFSLPFRNFEKSDFLEVEMGIRLQKFQLKSVVMNAHLHNFTERSIAIERNFYADGFGIAVDETDADTLRARGPPGASLQESP